MTQKKWYPRVSGLLFLLAFIGGPSAAMLAELNVSTDLATDFARNQDLVLQASVGLIIMAFACSGIAIALYPVLKEQHPASALGSVVFRGIEGIFHLLIPICYIIMSSVAQKLPYTEANSILQVLLELIRVYVLIATIAWGIGAMLYYYALFKADIIPHILSVWGLVAMPLGVISAILVFFLKMDSWAPPALILNIPIALQELGMAIWLIVKGTRASHKEEEQRG